MAGPHDVVPPTSSNMPPHVSAPCVKPTAVETPPTSVDSSSFDWDPDSVVAARQSRSQSLTDARSMAAMARHVPSLDVPPSSSSVSIATTAMADDATRSVAFLVVDTTADPAHDALVAQRRMRRTKSAELSSFRSLSLLQQELGYPKPHHKASPATSDPKTTPTGPRHRRASRRSRHSASSDAVATTNDKLHGRPAATSDAPTVVTSDMEADDEGDDGDDEEEENFLDHRFASVTGYARDTDGVVYYEIVVESTAHGPLSAYKVRRRYSEFRDLHRALARVMPTRRPKQNYHQPQHVYHESRLSLGGMGFLSTSGYGLHDSDATASSYSSRGISQSLHDHSSRSMDASESSSWLPPLPDSGGLWSYFQSDSPRFLENRARAFHAIVMAAQQHPLARASRLLNQFLGPPPDSFANSNYVSLNRFAAPTLRFSIEIQERKEVAKTISLKRRQRSPHHTGAVATTNAVAQHPPSIAE